MKVSTSAFEVLILRLNVMIQDKNPSHYHGWWGKEGPLIEVLKGMRSDQNKDDCHNQLRGLLDAGGNSEFHHSSNLTCCDIATRSGSHR